MMKLDPEVKKQVLWIAAGEAIMTALMIGVFALLGKFDRTVLFGGIAGGALAVLNFLVMAANLSNAADKAVQGDTKGGQAMATMSYAGRMVAIFVVLILLVKSGLCNVFASVIPLLFVRVIIMVIESFRKKEGTNV